MIAYRHLSASKISYFNLISPSFVVIALPLYSNILRIRLIVPVYRSTLILLWFRKNNYRFSRLSNYFLSVGSRSSILTAVL